MDEVGESRSRPDIDIMKFCQKDVNYNVSFGGTKAMLCTPSGQCCESALYLKDSPFVSSDDSALLNEDGDFDLLFLKASVYFR